MRLFVIAATLILSPMIAAAQTAPKQAPMFPVPAGSYCPLDAKATLCPAPPVLIPQEDHSNDAKLKQIDDYNKRAAEASRPKVPDEKPLFTPPPTPIQEYHVSVQPPQQGTAPPPIVKNAPPKQTGNGYEQMRRGMSAAPIKPLAQAKPFAPKPLFAPKPKQ